MLCVCGCDGAECHCYGYCCHDRGPYVVRVLKLSYSALQVSDVLFCLHIIMSLMQKYCFSPNPQTFFKNFLANSLHVQIFISTFAIATIIVRSTPHEQRARRYVQAQPTFSKRCGLIFLPIICRIGTRGASPLFMRSTPHCVEMPETEYGGSPSTCFYCPLWRKALLL